MLNIPERLPETIQNPQPGTKILFNDATDSKLKTKDENGVVEEISIGGGGASYLVYTALLSQSGTDAPVATVLENTLGGEVVWSRSNTGIYYGTLTGIFTAGKTSKSSTFTVKDDVLKLIRGEGSGTSNYYILVTSDYSDPGTGTDDILDISFIEIRVYP